MASPNPSGHVCPFLPLPHWQPCPPAWLGAWPPGTGPGTRRRRFPVSPGVAGAGSGFPSPQLLSSPLTHTDTLSPSNRSWLGRGETGFPMVRAGPGGGPWDGPQGPGLGALTQGSSPASRLQALPSRIGPTSRSRPPAPGRSSCGTLSWSCCGKRNTRVSSPGRGTTGSSSSRTPTRWLGSGESASASPR